MLNVCIQTAKAAGFDTRRVFQSLARRSLDGAAREQELLPMRERLRAILPDISDQFSEGFDPEEYRFYWEPKMRGQHAFQLTCLLRTIEELPGKAISVADIGDSAGSHLAYLKALLPAERIRYAVSVNLDSAAVAKIRAKGGEAFVGRAEEVDFGSDRFDVMTSFEMVEHLTDPIRFLHRLAMSSVTERLLISVPYVRRSRMGLQFLRSAPPLPERVTAERVHIFELSPPDWVLLCRFAGWSVAFQRIYRQYPRFSPLRGMAPVWRRLDFEGFLCLSLRRDLSVASRYADW